MVKRVSGLFVLPFKYFRNQSDFRSRHFSKLWSVHGVVQCSVCTIALAVLWFPSVFSCPVSVVMVLFDMSWTCCSSHASAWWRQELVLFYPGPEPRAGSGPHHLLKVIWSHPFTISSFFTSAMSLVSPWSLLLLKLFLYFVPSFSFHLSLPIYFKVLFKSWFILSGYLFLSSCLILTSASLVGVAWVWSNILATDDWLAAGRKVLVFLWFPAAFFSSIGETQPPDQVCPGWCLTRGWSYQLS